MFLVNVDVFELFAVKHIYIYYIYIYAHTRTHMIDIGLFNLMAIWLYIYMAYRTSKHTYYVCIYICVYFYIHRYLSFCHCVHPLDLLKGGKGGSDRGGGNGFAS